MIIRMLQSMRSILHTARLLDNNAPKFQVAMAKYKMILSVADLLNSENPDVVRECLALLVQLLADGNVDAQKNFIDHFKSTREETFFIDISERMKSAMDWIREVLLPLVPAMSCLSDVVGLSVLVCRPGISSRILPMRKIVRRT